MEYKKGASEAHNDRMTEVIFELTGINKKKIKSALDKYGVQELFENPQLVGDEKVERLIDFINVISFLNSEGKKDE